MRRMKRDTGEFESPEEENQQQETTGRPQRNQRSQACSKVSTRLKVALMATARNDETGRNLSQQEAGDDASAAAGRGRRSTIGSSET